MRALWIVSPVYQDSESFLLLREHILAQLSNGAFTKVTFVVIDDSAGADPHMQRLRDLGDVSILTPSQPLGHQRALVYALRTLHTEIHAEDTVVTIDADGEDKPADLPRLLAAVSEHPQTIALAYRTSRQETLRFKLAYFLFKNVFRICTGTIIRTGNYAAYSGAALKKMIQHPYFDHVYSAAILALHHNVTYIPCARGSRYFGQSQMPATKLVQHGLKMFYPFVDQIIARARLGAMITFVALLGYMVLTRTVHPALASFLSLVVALNVLLALVHFRKNNEHKAS